MNRLKIITMILSIVTAIMVAVCLKYTVLQIEQITSPPYLLKSEKTISYNVFENEGSIAEKKDIAFLLDYMEQLIKEYKLLLIAENIDNFGIGVYDPYHYFKYSSGANPFHTSNGDEGLLFVDSYYYHKYGEESTLESLGGKKIKVIGYIDPRDDLWDDSKELVYNYFFGPFICGKFLISAVDENCDMDFIKNKIRFAYQRANFSIEDMNSYQYTKWEIIKKMASNNVYGICIFIMIGMFINLFILYLKGIKKIRKLLRISIWLGAQTNAVMNNLLTKIIPYILVGNLIGSLSYFFIFRGTELCLNFNHLLASTLINSIVNILLLSSAVFIEIKIVMRGDLR